MRDCRGGVARRGLVRTARPDAGAMEEYAREPCPWRIVDDCGGAFTMGVIGGGVFQAIKGFRNAPVILSNVMALNAIHLPRSLKFIYLLPSLPSTPGTLSWIFAQISCSHLQGLSTNTPSFRVLS